jgi:hypothetical protein
MEACDTRPVYPCLHLPCCGFPKIINGIPQSTEHECQWTSEFGLVLGGSSTDGREVSLARLTLTCKRDPSHTKIVAPDLEEVRRNAMARAAIGLANSPLADNFVWPPIECRQCWDEKYQSGDYLQQEPGQLRRH